MLQTPTPDDAQRWRLYTQLIRNEIYLPVMFHFLHKYLNHDTINKSNFNYKCNGQWLRNYY